MFAPNITTHQLADHIHHERLSHAALIQKVARERSTDTVQIDRAVQRRITARRMAATLAGALLSLSIAAMAAGDQQSAAATTQPAQGGGVTLIR